MKRPWKRKVREPNVAIVRALVQAGEAAAASNGGKFVIAGHSLTKIPTSPMWYRSVHNPAKGYRDLVSLKTEDEAEAKTMVAITVADQLSDPFEEAHDLPVDAVVELYLKQVAGTFESWKTTSPTLLRGIEACVPGVTVGTFTESRQMVLMRGLAGGEVGRPMKVASIANCMILAKAAMAWACRPNGDGNILCDVKPPPIIYKRKHIAKQLAMPMPRARNWHASIDEMGAFLALIADDEGLRRWTFLALAFACRADVAATATSEQIDLRNDVYHLNPEGRTQIDNKYRPSLALPPSVLAEILCWGEGCWVGETGPNLRKRFKSAGARLKLGRDFIPSSVRDFCATMLREAYVLYGIPEVSEQQHLMWLGHRREDINALYGQFGSKYMLLARNAVECMMHDLDEVSGGVLFRDARAAGTLPSQPVVIDPRELRGSRRRRLSGNSGNSDVPSALCDGGKRSGPSRQLSREQGRTARNHPVVIGGDRGKMGEIGLRQGQFSQVQASPQWSNEPPNGIGSRLLSAGFRIIEFWPDGNQSGQPELLIVGEAAKLLSDDQARQISKSAKMTTQEKMRFYAVKKRNERGLATPTEATSNR